MNEQVMRRAEETGGKWSRVMRKRQAEVVSLSTILIINVVVVVIVIIIKVKVIEI